MREAIEAKHYAGHRAARSKPSGPAALMRIAVGVDGHPEGRDAVTLGAAISRLIGGELLLVAVHPGPLVVLPPELDWKSVHAQAQAMLAEARDAIAPDARIAVETDLSVPRALHRVCKREHRGLLIVGSSREAAQGQVRIGGSTRQLLSHSECALAVAPRGLHERRDLSLAAIGVGYDGEPESQAALALGCAIAAAVGAELHVCAVVDDRPPAVGWPQVGLGQTMDDWYEVVQQNMLALRQQASGAVRGTGAAVEIDSLTGRPASALLALAERVDLLVIGSRRWGPASRVLLGSTGEALMHEAACPVVAVPRPAS